MLDEAAQWCHRRQIFVHLEAGTYHSRRTRVDVLGELQALLRELGRVEV